jgi:hypothetical protein
MHTYELCKGYFAETQTHFWDLSIHWRTPEVLITVNNGEKHSLVQVLNSAFNELNEVRQSRKFKEEIKPCSTF